MIKICECCGKEFETDNSAKKCCSITCATKQTKSNMKLKKCVICGEMFRPSSGIATICNKEHHVKCTICGKDMVLTKRMYHDKITTCSRACAKEKTRRLNQEKYGCDHPMQNKQVQEHHRAAMLEKYGVESPLQSREIKDRAIEANRTKFGCDWALGSKEMHETIKQTMIEKYGAPTTFQSKELMQKAIQTNIEKYGAPNPMSSSVIRDKSKNTTYERYGVYNPIQNPEIYEKMRATRLENHGAYWTDEMSEKFKQTCLEKYGVDNPSKSPEIQQKIKDILTEKYGVCCGLMLAEGNHAQIISNINRSFAEKLNELGYETEFEFRISGRPYDIHIKDTNIVIEIDPTYTHNSFDNHWHNPVPTDYHLTKTQIAKAAGYRCIHVFDWEDWNKILMLVKPKKPVYARKCSIFKLNREVTDEFINKYHLQGTVRGQLLRLGLVYDGELVQVMTFGKSRYDKSAAVELLRLCTKEGLAVVGGAERLFKFAVEQMCVNNIISYCDLSKFDGAVYERLGMKLVRQTAPQEVWSNKSEKITANLLRKRGYDQLFGTNYGKGTSNEQLMLEHGWLPVCDCGQTVYKYN